MESNNIPRLRDSSASMSSGALPHLKYRQSATIVGNDYSGNVHYIQRSFDIKEGHIKGSNDTTFQFPDEDKKEQD